MKRKFKHHHVGEQARKNWWESLTTDQKHFYRDHYMKVREMSLKTKHPYPSLYDVKGIALGKLSVKQIHRIWVFREHKI